MDQFILEYEEDHGLPPIADVVSDAPVEAIEPMLVLAAMVDLTPHQWHALVNGDPV